MKKIVTYFSLMMLSFVLLGCASLSNNTPGGAPNNATLSQLEKENIALKAENQSLRSGVIESSAQQSQSRYDTLAKTFQDEINQGQLTVNKYKNIVKVGMEESVFFNSGSSKLKESGKELLKKLVGNIKTMPDTVVRVVGHTDNVPIKPKLQTVIATNWEFSALRATRIVRYLQEAGISSKSLVAVGRGDNDPIASNDTDLGRKQNRRIEIGIVDKEMESSIGETEGVKTDQKPQ